MLLSLLRRALSPVARRKSCRTSAERLEDRTLLAGNVSIFLAGGGQDIRVVGNAASNEINVEVTDTVIRFTGVNGTTLNWGNNVLEFSKANRRDLRFAMGAGDDIVTMTGTLSLSGDLVAYTHGGNDTLNIGGAISANRVLVSGGANDDIINLSGSTSTDRTVVMGDGIELPQGNDTITLSNVAATGDVRVLAGFGNNTVDLDQVTSGEDIRVWGGTGLDSIAISRSSSGRDITIFGATGHNVLGLAGITVGRDVKIFGGTDSDTVGLYGNIHGANNITRNLTLVLFAGDDNVEVLGTNNIGGKAYLFAAAGDDHINRPGISNDDIGVELEVEHGAEPFHPEVETEFNNLEDRLTTI